MNKQTVAAAILSALGHPGGQTAGISGVNAEHAAEISLTISFSMQDALVTKEFMASIAQQCQQKPNAPRCFEELIYFLCGLWNAFEEERAGRGSHARGLHIAATIERLLQQYPEAVPTVWAQQQC